MSNNEKQETRRGKSPPSPFLLSPLSLSPSLSSSLPPTSLSFSSPLSPLPLPAQSTFHPETGEVREGREGIKDRDREERGRKESVGKRERRTDTGVCVCSVDGCGPRASRREMEMDATKKKPDGGYFRLCRPCCSDDDRDAMHAERWRRSLSSS